MGRPQPKIINLQGGFNITTPALSTPFGDLVQGFNYECDQDGGYAWVKGYEALDGAPTVLVNGDFYTDDDWVFGTGWAHEADLQELTGTAASGNSTKAIAIISGQTYRMRTIIRGYVSGSVKIQSGTKNATYSSDGEHEFEFVADAATDLEIIPTAFTGIIESVHIMPIVPGEGHILGVCEYNAVYYAIRNAVGGLSAEMYKSSVTGWTLVDLGAYVKFNLGTVAFTNGDTLTDSITGATGIIEDYYVISGAFTSNDAAGYIAISGRTGNFVSGNAITDGSGGAGTLSASHVDVSFNPDGRYEFVVDNLYGDAGKKAMYFVNGEGDAWQFVNDGTLPLEHGAAGNPVHIGQYNNHIFVGFDEGASLFSETGKALGWDGVLTAGQYDHGDQVNGYKTLPQALLILCQTNTYILYGTSISNFDLQTFEDESGGVKYSIQTIFSTYFVNPAGLVNLSAVQDQGNFKDSAISKKVRTYLNSRIEHLVCSTVNRDKSQIRLFFDDETALYFSFVERKLIGISLPVLLKDQPKCMYNGSDSNKKEITIFGADNGLVFEMEQGNRFNGHKIASLAKLAYCHFGSPSHKHRVRKADLYITASSWVKLKISIDYNYGSLNRSSMSVIDIEKYSGVAQWDVSKWDQFLWDSTGDPRIEIPLEGSGIACSMTIYNEGLVQDDHRLDTLNYHYSNRGRNR